MNHRLINSLLIVASLLFFSFSLQSCRGVHQSASVHKKAKYKSVRGGRINRALLAQSNRKNTRIVIDIADQKGFLLVNGKIAVRTPISTARPGKYTPRGTFRISERVRSGKISTIYNVSMPYWMRLSGSPFGVHAGYVPGYPASAGCIRLPANMAKVFYDNTSYGTRVSVYSSWSGG